MCLFGSVCSWSRDLKPTRPKSAACIGILASVGVGLALAVTHWGELKDTWDLMTSPSKPLAMLSQPTSPPSVTNTPSNTGGASTRDSGTPPRIKLVPGPPVTALAQTDWRRMTSGTTFDIDSGIEGRVYLVTAQGIDVEIVPSQSNSTPDWHLELDGERLPHQLGIQKVLVSREAGTQGKPSILALVGDSGTYIDCLFLYRIIQPLREFASWIPDNSEMRSWHFDDVRKRLSVRSGVSTGQPTALVPTEVDWPELRMPANSGVYIIESIISNWQAGTISIPFSPSMDIMISRGQGSRKTSLKLANELALKDEQVVNDLEERWRVTVLNHHSARTVDTTSEVVFVPWSARVNPIDGGRHTIRIVIGFISAHAPHAAAVVIRVEIDNVEVGEIELPTKATPSTYIPTLRAWGSPELEILDYQVTRLLHKPME